MFIINVCSWPISLPQDFPASSSAKFFSLTGESLSLQKPEKPSRKIFLGILLLIKQVGLLFLIMTSGLDCWPRFVSHCYLSQSVSHYFPFQIDHAKCSACYFYAHKQMPTDFKKTSRIESTINPSYKFLMILPLHVN